MSAWSPWVAQERQYWALAVTASHGQRPESVLWHPPPCQHAGHGLCHVCSDAFLVVELCLLITWIPSRTPALQGTEGKGWMRTRTLSFFSAGTEPSDHACQSRGQKPRPACWNLSSRLSPPCQAPACTVATWVTDTL